MLDTTAICAEVVTLSYLKTHMVFGIDESAGILNILIMAVRFEEEIQCLTLSSIKDDFHVLY
jgi:hypothetical protein